MFHHVHDLKNISCFNSKKSLHSILVLVLRSSQNDIFECVQTLKANVPRYRAPVIVSVKYGEIQT